MTVRGVFISCARFRKKSLFRLLSFSSIAFSSAISSSRRCASLSLRSVREKLIVSTIALQKVIRIIRYARR